MRHGDRDRERRADEHRGHGELGPADHRNTADEQPEQRREPELQPVARDLEQGDQRAGHRGEHHTREQQRHDRRLGADSGKPPHQHDRKECAGECQRRNREQTQRAAEEQSDDGT